MNPKVAAFALYLAFAFGSAPPQGLSAPVTIFAVSEEDRGEATAIGGTERHAVDGTGVAAEREDFLAGFRSLRDVEQWRKQVGQI